MKKNVDADRIHELNRRFHDEVEADTYDDRMGVCHDPEIDQRVFNRLAPDTLLASIKFACWK